MRTDLHPYIRIVVNHSQKCNMRCTWCHEEGMQLTSRDSLLTPAQIGELARRFYALGARKFKLVGGEPTLRNDLAEIIAELRAIDPTLDLSMVTNGTRLAARAADYAEAGLNRINVSVFSLNELFFARNVGPVQLMDRVVAGIDRTVELGLCGKINHVYHERTDLLDVLAFARSRGVRVNVLNQIPSLSSPVGMPISELLAVLDTLPVEWIGEENDPYSLPVRLMKLKDGTEIEVKHQEIGAQDRFASCGSCTVRALCREGIFALRITPAGRLQPCIVREDNSLDLMANPTVASLRSYLAAL